MRGCVNPTHGCRKNSEGIKAIQIVNASTLVVVPTIDLMEQWAENISRYLSTSQNPRDIPIGRLGGGKDDIQAITVTTYDSAYLRASTIGNQFKLVIFDEVHHLPASGYRSIAEQFIAPYRLGSHRNNRARRRAARTNPVSDWRRRVSSWITAALRSKTPGRIHHRQDTGKPDSARAGTVRGQSSKIPGRSQTAGIQRSINVQPEKTNHDVKQQQDCTEAMLARNKANEIALNSESKIDQLQKISAAEQGHKDDNLHPEQQDGIRALNRFLIPHITYRTVKEERQNVLEGFKSGRYHVVVTSKVLDEGVDVPDAEMGVIMSGTGSGRELIQRLGRILRPKQDGRKARLVELVSRHTREINTSAKRITALKRNSDVTQDDSSSRTDMNTNQQKRRYPDAPI